MGPFRFFWPEKRADAVSFATRCAAAGKGLFCWPGSIFPRRPLLRPYPFLIIPRLMREILSAMKIYKSLIVTCFLYRKSYIFLGLPAPAAMSGYE